MFRWTDLIAVVVLLALATWFANSVPAVLQLDPDEGINLMKARLVLQGHALYSEIWSDQPPLFTYALASWNRAFGESPQAARVLVALFSAVALLALASVARQLDPRYGKTVLLGLVMILLLLASRRYARLSVSVMIGLPALAVACVPLWLVVAGPNSRRWAFSGIAGVLMGAAFHVKLNVFVMLPAIYAAMALMPDRSRRWLDAVSFTVVMLASFIVIAGMTSAADPTQLVGPHLPKAHSFSLSYNLARLGEMILENGPVTLAAIAGIVHAFVTRNRKMLIPALWMLGAMITMCFASPLQESHRLMFELPMALLAASLITAGLQGFARPHWIPRVVAGAASLVLAVGVYNCVSLPLDFFNTQRARLDPEIMQHLYQADPRHYCLSDDALYPYAAGLATPPEAAVISAKRLRKGQFDEQVMHRLVELYTPEYVVLERFEWDASLHNALKARYRQVYRADGKYVYQHIAP